MAQPLAQYDTDKTPLAIVDQDQFINHVNEEHQGELAMFVDAFTTKSMGEYDIASIKELCADGILLNVITTSPYKNTASAFQDNSSESNNF